MATDDLIPPTSHSSILWVVNITLQWVLWVTEERTCHRDLITGKGMRTRGGAEEGGGGEVGGGSRSIDL